jgi:hypothetical protein
VLGPADKNDPANVNEKDIADYIKRFVGAAESDPRIEVVVYFALADGMHNCYGVNRANGDRKVSVWNAMTTI